MPYKLTNVSYSLSSSGCLCQPSSEPVKCFFSLVLLLGCELSADPPLLLVLTLRSILSVGCFIILVIWCSNLLLIMFSQASNLVTSLHSFSANIKMDYL